MQELADDVTHPSDATLNDLVSDVMPVVNETKKGWKTTEFWVALVGIILTQLQVLHLPGKYGDTIATIAFVASYILARGFAKQGVPAVEPSPVGIAPTDAIVQRAPQST
jgi:hypothetical protein